MPGDIDGAATMGGFAIANAWMLGINPLNWFLDAELGPAFLYPALHAIGPIQAGLCHTCIVFRLIQRQPAGFTMPPSMDGGGGSGQFLFPFGSISPTNWAGLMTRRHMIEFGTTEEHFAAHAVTQREHARLNDDALVRDPLTVDDYLDARYMSQAGAHPRLRLSVRRRLGGGLHDRGTGARLAASRRCSSSRTRCRRSTTASRPSPT